MTREDNIIVPRWFLKNVENTLRIQNNINLDKETGETCQDRNVRESLNGLCKLLKGEELTGLERLEKLQPSIPSDLDEAEEKIASDIAPTHPDIDWDECFEKIKDGIKAGAEWMAGQGVSMLGRVGIYGVEVESITKELREAGFNIGEEIILQIRKKQ